MLKMSPIMLLMYIYDLHFHEDEGYYGSQIDQSSMYDYSSSNN